MKQIFTNLMRNRTLPVILIVSMACSLLLSAGCGINHKLSDDDNQKLMPPSWEGPIPGTSPAYDTGPVYTVGTPSETIVEEAGASFTVSVSVSRSNGVAPLSVFFDATGTTGLADDGFFADNAAYMDATFAWDFDADNADSTGTHEKASGFVAAHVFERPGIYRVHLDVYDAAGNTESVNIPITVSAFSGTTYYVADNGSDENTGLTMDDPFLTPAHALSSSILDSNVRVLFKNGDIFTIENMVVVSDETGPIIIGAYSDPGDPSTVRPLVHTNAVNTDWSTIHFWDCSDIRIIDIATRARGESSEEPRRHPHGIGWGNSCIYMLKYQTEEYQNGGMSMSPSGHYNTVARCAFHDTTNTGYTDNTGPNDANAIIGNFVYDKNLVDTNNEEHIFRLQGGSRYFIANNTFGPNIKVNYDALTIRGNSEKVVVYGNKLTGYVQAFWPQNRDSAEEYQHHCIMDSNLIIGQGLYGGDRQGAIGMHAKDIVIRNNIVYDYEYGVGIGDDSVVGPSQRIKVYNNTFINPREDSTFHIISVNTACFDIEVTNNLMLDTGGSNTFYTAFLDIREGTVYNGESDYNIFYGNTWAADPALFDGSTLSEWQLSTFNDQNSSISDPDLLSTDPDDEDIGKLQASSLPVIDAGAFTPAALDYHGNARDSSRDIGACEYYSP